MYCDMIIGNDCFDQQDLWEWPAFAMFLTDSTQRRGVTQAHRFFFAIKKPKKLLLAVGEGTIYTSYPLVI